MASKLDLEPKVRSPRITKALALKVLETVDAGLVQGLGRPIPGQMCVEAAVAYALGLPHNDKPACVHPKLSEFKIKLNDHREGWDNNQARAKGLRRLALIQLGSTRAFKQGEFSRRSAELLMKKYWPLALKQITEPEEKKQLTRIKKAFAEAKKAPTRGNLYKLRDISYSVSKLWVFAASISQCILKEEAPFFPEDVSLPEFAEDIVQILVAMGLPGKKWLELAPLEEPSP